jgi:hypothetical protein
MTAIRGGIANGVIPEIKKHLQTWFTDARKKIVL